MTSTEKVAVVTGANKGIGLAIVKGLCKRFKGTVYLTARNEEKGQKAVEKIKSNGCFPKFHHLDITNQESVDKFKEHIKSAYGGLDLLINNAAICYLKSSTVPFGEQAENTVEVNYFGTVRICQALFPLLRNNAKVINLSSAAGHLSRIPSESLRSKIGSSNLTLAELNLLAKKFIKDAKNNQNEPEGWGVNAYRVSKVLVSALSFLQQRDFENENPNRDISVNAVHPGEIDTDINGHHGTHSTDEGASVPLYVALESNYKGKYVWCDKTTYDWFASWTPVPKGC